MISHARLARSIVRLLPLLVLCSHVGPVRGDVIDTFDDAEGWSLVLADGVRGEIVEVDGAVRLDYDFTAGAGYCVLRREVGLPLDPNYRFRLRYRGEGPKNTLEFKLIDRSGENVWWSVDRDFAFPPDWTWRSTRRRHFSFAWGPGGGDPLDRVGAIEIAVTATRGGKGSLWLDELVYERLPDVEPQPVEPHAWVNGGTDLGRVGPDGSVGWGAGEGDTLELRFDSPVEFSAIELIWESVPETYRVDIGSAGSTAASARVVQRSDGGTDTVFTPETEARIVRITAFRGGGRLEAVRFLPVEQLPDANAYFQWLADRASRGTYPKYFESLTPWTVIGLPQHEGEALVSETGAIEPIKGGYSLEPFIVRDGRVETWASGALEHSLDEGSVPIPSVRWTLDGLRLEVTALAGASPTGDRVLARYRVTNTSDRENSLRFALAARPFQVLPAAQFLNTVGGAVPGRSVDIDPGGIRVGDVPFAVVAEHADAVVMAEVTSGTLIGRLADLASASDQPRSSKGQFASAALLYDLRLRPGASRDLIVSLPMHDAGGGASPPPADFDRVLQAERTLWQEVIGGIDILVPESERRLRDVIRANLAYILINADGPAIRPGSRSYERSWIRDGAMTSAALIATGHAETARAFIEWYAEYQYRDGKVPCVVDSRGPDPVDENDAPGQFIFAIRNVTEMGGEPDIALARALYPRVRNAVGYIEAMRSERLTREYTESDDPILRACAGLVPESISHEGYSAKPMHSYWDDFWIYRGLWDAVHLAELLGESEDHARFFALAQNFSESLGDSVRRAAEAHGIGYVPGCVELGDFDATSTAIALYPTDAGRVIDRELLETTFARAWQATEARINGGPWDGMTPYEIRLVGTFVRLGWVERAHAYLAWLLERQDPGGWRQWGEIAYREDRPCRFVGDMPHTWVGSGAILAVLSLFAYEDGDRIALAAGVPAGWLEEGRPIGVRGLVTRYGTLNYILRRKDGVIDLEILPGHQPPGGYTLDAKRLLGGEGGVAVVADRERLEPDAAGIVVLRPSTRSVTLTRLSESP